MHLASYSTSGKSHLILALLSKDTQFNWSASTISGWSTLRKQMGRVPSTWSIALFLPGQVCLRTECCRQGSFPTFSRCPFLDRNNNGGGDWQSVHSFLICCYSSCSKGYLTQTAESFDPIAMQSSLPLSRKLGICRIATQTSSSFAVSLLQRRWPPSWFWNPSLHRLFSCNHRVWWGLLWSACIWIFWCDQDGRWYGRNQGFWHGTLGNHEC